MSLSVGARISSTPQKNPVMDKLSKSQMSLPGWRYAPLCPPGWRCLLSRRTQLLALFKAHARPSKVLQRLSPATAIPLRYTPIISLPEEPNVMDAVSGTAQSTPGPEVRVFVETPRHENRTDLLRDPVRMVQSCQRLNASKS